MPDLYTFPFPFWIVLALLAGGGAWAWGQMRTGVGLPVLAVLGTAAAWYVVDVFYNDYVHTYALEFTGHAREEAWWEVALFLLVFLVLVMPVHRWINGGETGRESAIWHLQWQGFDRPGIQDGLEKLLRGCLIIWGILAVGAAIRLQGDFLYYYCPYLAYRADPWSRDRIGAGFDFLWTVAMHVHMFLAAIFGVMLALLKNPRLRSQALFGVVTAWPYFIFDRTRNYMLAAVLPGVLAWVFLRLRLPILGKIAVLAVLFMAVHAWFDFVMLHRSDNAIANVFSQEGFDLDESSDVHQEGLNMYGELCWINTFIDQGIYKPNWGQRYFAEAVNPIPRTLWPGKPLIGIDYAILRGQSYDDGAAGVGATISTGMIGQGVVNFGKILGPSAAAFLMSLWVAVLARLDLHGESMGQIPLYGLGLILTFNLGRDITLLTLYTFIFGAMVVWVVERSIGLAPLIRGPRPPDPKPERTPARAQHSLSRSFPLGRASAGPE